MPENNTFEEIYSVLQNSKNVIISVDSRPDFDAFGSALSMAAVLEEMDKNVRVIFNNNFPDNFREFFDLSNVELDVDPNSVEFNKYDLWICQDSGTLEHVSANNDFAPPESLGILNIDHHGSNNYYGKFNYIDPTASSTCQILYKMFKQLKIPLSDKVKNYLMLGIITDSMYFLAGYTTAETLEAAAELMREGVDMTNLAWTLTSNFELDEYKFRKLIYSNFKLVPEYKYGYSTLTNEELTKEGIDLNKVYSKSSDLIKTLIGTNFVYVISEDENKSGTYNISFRSHLPNFDVSVFAEDYGGGGHKVAAGGTINASSMTDAEQKVKAYLESKLNN